MDTHEKITNWAKKLTKEQMREVIINLVERGMETEDIRMGDLAPYWESCGEPLVEGQQTWADEEG